jgi:hypothetical protein
MGLRFRKTISLGKHIKLNISKSGVSVSTKIGRATLNSRGTKTFRIMKGVSYTKGKSKK